MSRGQNEVARAELITALDDEAGRKFSTATILYQLAIADRMGVGLTDLVCLEILSRTGAITAGELAELSGLTTGAITGVVDRLEKAGFARRVNDPNDRRRVMLELRVERFAANGGNPYDGLNERFNALYAEYSEDELALLLEFLRKSITIFDEEALRLREQTAARAQADKKPHTKVNIRARMEAQAEMHVDMRARMDADAQMHIRREDKGTRKFSAPRGNLEAARWEWLSGSAQVNLRGVPELSELYRAEFKHDIPLVRDQDGNISIQYRHRTLFGRGGGNADVELNTATMWELNFECGASNLELDLREISLRGFTLKSKMSKLSLLLPPPTGTQRLYLECGTSHLDLKRPKNVPVRLEFQGNDSRLIFERLRATVNTESRESPDYKRATNRYVIEIVGGMNRVTVEESK